MRFQQCHSVCIRRVTSLSDTCFVRFEWPDGSVYDGEFRNNNVGNHRAASICHPTDPTLFNLSYSFIFIPSYVFDSL